MGLFVSRIKGFGGIREINRRIKGSDVIVDNRDALATELINLGTSQITDILTWNDEGEVKVKASADIPDHALSAIKRIRVLPGNGIEVEMIDKVRVLQTLAKSAGLLDREQNANRPAVVEIQMLGPEGDPPPKKKGKSK